MAPMREMRLPTAALALLVLLAAAAAALADRARVDLLGGRTDRDVTVTGIGAETIRYRTRADGERSAPLDELVSLSFAREARRPGGHEPQEVELILRDGDRVRGSLLPSAQDRVAISSPLLGPLDYLVDSVAEIRFLGAFEEAPEKPDLAGEMPDLDLFYYKSLDHLEGTYSRTNAGAIAVRRATGGDQTVDFEELLVIRFAEMPAPRPVAGRLAVLLLADGSRLTAQRIASDGRKLVATTVRDNRIEVALTDLLAITMKGGRFVYLSDLVPTKTVVTPWLGDTYAWDRPRFDTSFLDRPLVAGGERYLKGIGVISGTTLTFDLNGEFARFTSLVALDDSAGEEGDAVFEVLVDGEVRYTSETVRRLPEDGKPLRVPEIDVTGAKELSIRVTWVDDYVMDFADWLDPMLIRAK